MNSPEQMEFQTEAGKRFSGVSAENFSALFAELQSGYGLTAAQLCEAASYSSAMVMRVALGLSAEGARVGALVSDCLSGWVALATLRHLINGGTEGAIVICDSGATPSENLALQLRPLEKMGAHRCSWSNESRAEVASLVQDSHALICGLYSFKVGVDNQHRSLVETVNEHQTPLHAVQAPLGVDVNTGERDTGPLFASSTLSLGVPLVGLARGSEYTGRHYVCDISITPELYLRYGMDLTALFSEQPVVQIFPTSSKSK